MTAAYVWSKRNVLSVGVYTTHNKNGNPRRGFITYNADGAMTAFTEEGYTGVNAVIDRFPGVPNSASSIRILPSEYNRLVRWEKLRMADAAAF